MSESRRKRFLSEVARLPENPYAFGVALQGNQDRRNATLADTDTVFWVTRGMSTTSVITIVQAN
ncbi:hypothetical protein ACFWIA_12740 [Streptomyces sp. NPDC127068]|uniref:hypothetical protein n=1 Tax=Streptomyces sp. NPDC127068 TaxID=3347127 RepID=UPI00364CBB7A